MQINMGHLKPIFIFILKNQTVLDLVEVIKINPIWSDKAVKKEK